MTKIGLTEDGTAGEIVNKFTNNEGSYIYELKMFHRDGIERWHEDRVTVFTPKEN